MSELSNKIVDMLLSVPCEKRKAVLREIQYNEYFCWHCGYGSKENPNRDCQCWNDE